MKTILERVSRFDAHHRLFWSTIAGVVTFFLLQSLVHVPTQWIATWDVSALVYLSLAWITITQAEPKANRRAVRLQDTSRTILLILVLLAAGASIVAVAFVLGASKELPQGERYFHIALSALAVISSWLLTHTVFALHYAHIFYSDQDDGEAKEIIRGLKFPGTQQPDYLDFVYFSFVIGMTCQVSDVQITSQRLRRQVFRHGVLSFAFNTIILALSVNIISNLI